MSKAMSDGELWDHVRYLFGIGDWHDGSGIPYWKYRGMEVHKTRLQRTKRRVTCEELAQAADYCKANGIDIRHISWLYKHLRDSAAWHAARQRTLATADLDDAIDEAIAIEMRDPSGSLWLDRLVRARGDARQEVYDQWTKWRESSARSQTTGPGPASSAPERRQA